MRLPVMVLTIAAAAGFAWRNPDEVAVADRFDKVVQRRLAEPQPKQLGLSRIVVPSSFGQHFRPSPLAARDFVPENDAERALIAEFEAQGVQLGMYLFGESVRRFDAASPMSYRALKGPGAITAGTSRPRRSLGLGPMDSPGVDFPSWEAVIPVAQKAMAAFERGEGSYVTRLGSWTVEARPTLASSERCLGCHNHEGEPWREAKFQRGDPLGGAIYIHRTRQADSAVK